MKRSSIALIPLFLAVCIVAGVAWFVRWHRASEARGDSQGPIPAVVDGGTTDSSLVAAVGVTTENPESAARVVASSTDAPASGVTTPSADQVFRKFDAWTLRYLSTSDAAARSALVAEGSTLARERRALMAELIRIDPEAAIAASVPEDLRRGLPEVVDDLLEERVFGSGEFRVMAAIPVDAGDDDFCSVRREVVLADRTFVAYVPGSLSDIASRSGVEVSGVAVATSLAVETVSEASVDEPSTTVEPVEISATGPRTAEADGTTVVARSAYTTGTKRVLFIRVRFADQDAAFEPQTEASLQQSVAEATAFLEANSSGLVTVEPTITPVYTLPKTADWYKANDTSGYARNVLDAARTIAATPGTVEANAGLPAYNYREFDLEAVRYTGGPGAFNGQSFIGSRGCWLKTDTSGVMAHELSHNLGLWHANAWSATDPHTVTGPGRNIEYGDVFDTMGTSAGGGAHFNTYEKNRLDWLPPGAVEDVAVLDNGGVYRIAAHDHALSNPDATGTVLALRAPRDGDRDYWMEFRQDDLWAGNTAVMNGLVLRWDPWSGSNGGTQLIDTTPYSSDGRRDGPVAIGRTFSDPVANLHITPLRKIDGQLEVEVRRGPFPGNRAPVVELSASSLEVSAGQMVSFEASATDADGDDLAWSWDLGDGPTGENSSSATKTWLADGDHRVRVVVSDRRGGTASASVVVRVGTALAAGSRISGVVRDLDGQSVADVRITNGMASYDPAFRATWTDADGSYTLVGVPEGAWSIEASRPGWVFARVNSINPVTTPADAADADFAAVRRGFRVSGLVLRADGTPAMGAVVTDGLRSEPVDANGGFVFGGLDAGTYTFEAALAGTSFEPVTAIVAYGDAETSPIREVVYTLAGEIRGLAAGEVATVTDGHRVTTTTEQGSGENLRHMFTLEGVPAGTWHLRAIISGGSASPVSFINPLQVGGDVANLVLARDGSRRLGIGGTVTDREVGLAGLNVMTDGASTVTDSGGGYWLAGLSDGAHVVHLTDGGSAFSPASREVELAGADATGQDFAAVHALESPVFVHPAQALAPLDEPFFVLRALADDDGGSQNLCYTWSVVDGTPGPVTFLGNDSNSAGTTVAQVAAAGTYVLRVTATDAHGLSASSDVTVEVVARPVRVVMSTVPEGMTVGDAGPFAALCFDQFGHAMSSAGVVVWSVNGGGTIDATGWFTATDAGDDFVVVAQAGSSAARGLFSVARSTNPPAIVRAAQASPDVIGSSLATTLSVGATSELGDAGLTYTWSVSGTSPGPVVFLPNGGDDSDETVAQFSRAGDYTLRVLVRDAEGRTAESTVAVVVQETIASWRNRFFPLTQLDNPAFEASVWGADADPDGDGIVNLLEYAFDLNPLVPSTEGLPTQDLAEVDGVEYLAVSFHPNQTASDLLFVPQITSDLETWDTNLVLVGADGGDLVTYRDTSPAAGHTKRFVRVQVSTR